MSRTRRHICSRSIAWSLLVTGIVSAGKVCADQTYDQTNPSHVWDLSTQNWDASTDAWTNGNNAIFGGTAVNVDVNGAISVGNITFNSNGWNIGDPTSDGSLSFGGSPSIITVTNATDTDTISANILSGTLSKAGAGTLVLSGNNTFSGNVTVSAGFLKVTSANALGDTTGTTAVSNLAMLVLGNGVTISGETVSIAGAGTNNAGALQVEAGGTATWAGTINLDSGARVGAQSGGTLILSGVIQNGAGTTLAIGEAPGAASPGTVVVSGTNNTYTGSTQIVRGVLQLGANNALPATTIIDVSSSNSATEDSVFDLNGFNQTVTGIQRTNTVGAGYITNNGAAPSLLTVTDTQARTFSGIIRDGASTVALTKTGTGTMTLSGQNAYTGATTISAGTLTLSGSLTGTAISTSGGTAATAGALNETSTGTINGAITITVASGNFPSGSSTFTPGATLGGANTFTGQVIVNGNGLVYVTNGQGLGGTTAGTLVNSGEVVLANGITVTGENILINGNGSNNNGALQSAPGTLAAPTSATWAGTIVAGSATRIGGGDNSTLNVNGVISGASSSAILFSRGTNAVTVLNAVNTYTGDTQLFANAGTGDTLKIGVDNAINALSRLSMISAAPTQTMTLDLNGHILTLRAVDTSGTPSSPQLLVIANNAVGTTSTFSVGDPAAANTATSAGVIKDGASGAGGMSLAKVNANTQILIGANTYTGSTTVNAGTLQIGASGTGGSNGTLASTSFFLNGGTFALNNAGSTNNNTNRIADSSVFTMNGGGFLLTGSSTAASSERIGSFVLNTNLSRITATSGGTQATINATQISRAANGGIALVNGANLGQDSTSSVGRIILDTAPVLIGTTAPLSTGINASVQNTQIVPYLLGEADATTGAGTVTGTPNTFVTYDPGTGLRPLNLASEFTLNSFAAGNNIHLTSTTSTGTATINSLILDGASASLTGTLTVSSGAILFSSGTSLGITGGTLAFGSQEGIVTIDSTANTMISSVITGSAGISYYGTGTLVLATQQNTYSGNTLLAVGTVIPQGSSQGPAGAPTSGPFGTGTLILGGSSMRATTSTAITVGNPVSFAADTTIISGGTDQPLTFSGPVTLTGNRILTQNSTANTSFTGNIGDGGNGFGLTVAGSTSSAPVVLSGTNTYTGATAVKGSTLVVGGSLSGSSAVTVGDAANLTRLATLGGAGTVGNVTVGAAAGNTGATLMPHAGSASTAAGVTFHANSVTFADSSAHLSLQIGRTSAYTGATTDGTTGGDVSDHLATSSALTLNGADLQLSLLTTTGYTPVNGDLFFLTINSGGAVNGTFSSLNKTATNLDEGSVFALNAQFYEITYQASFATNSFTGGHDIALLAVVPEPSAFVSLLGGLACLIGTQRSRRAWKSRRVA